MAEEEEKKEDNPEKKESKEVDKIDEIVEEEKEVDESDAEKVEDENKKENSIEIKTLAQAQVLLQKAAETIDSLKTEIKNLSDAVKKGEEAEQKLTKIVKERHSQTVDKLIKKKLSLGIIKEEGVEAQKEIMDTINLKTIKLMTDELDNVKPIVRKESLKGAEEITKIDEVSKIKKLMAGAGFKKEFIESYKNE